MEFDAVVRFQFAFSIAFHICFRLLQSGLSGLEISPFAAKSDL